ncbi:hypothetical protein GCM10010493_32250 [Streptomyces lavendulae subsp. grasserius]
MSGRPGFGVTAWGAVHAVQPKEGETVADRVRAAAPGGVDASIDTFGDGYVEPALALGVETDPTARSSSGPGSRPTARGAATGPSRWPAYAPAVGAAGSGRRWA